MSFLKQDLFASEFQFNMGSYGYKRGTSFGLLLSIVSLVIVLSYFIYLFSQYFNNEMDPKISSQSFITSSMKEIPLSQDLVGFQFYLNDSMTIQEYQQLMNKTYIVYQSQFYYQDVKNNIYQSMNLDVVQCTEPSLKGLFCIDFSKISNYSLIHEAVDGNYVYSTINIYTYGCLDLDQVKTTTPSNCADQTEIDSVINNAGSFLNLKLKTQQYNTTSMKIQTDYRTIYGYLLSNQVNSKTIRAQKQVTYVKQGLIFQSKQSYSSPIQYDQDNQYLDKKFSLETGFGPYGSVIIELDEIVQQFQIQYPSIIEIFALLNGIITLVLAAKHFGILYSQNLIKQDFFMLTLQNQYQDKYEKLLQQHNLIEVKYDISLKDSSIQSETLQDISQELIKNDIALPSFQTKNFGSCEINLLSNRQKNQQINQEMQQNNLLIELASNSAILAQKNQENENMKIGLQSPKKSQFQISQTLRNKKSKRLDKQKSSPQSEKENYKINIKIDNHEIQSQKSQILDEAISQKLKSLQSVPIKQKIQSVIFKCKFLSWLKCFKQKGDTKNMIQKVRQHTNKNLSIYEMYKDIIQLKKAIAILLDKNQLASLQFVGLSENCKDLDVQSEKFLDNYQKTKEKLSHYEKQFFILESQALQDLYVKKFFKKFEQDKNTSQLDNRIISSIFNNAQ